MEGGISHLLGSTVRHHAERSEAQVTSPIET